MVHKRLVLVIIFMLVFSYSWAAQKSAGPQGTSVAKDAKASDQQIGDFSLSGFGDKGMKWSSRKILSIFFWILANLILLSGIVFAMSVICICVIFLCKWNC